MTLEGGAMTKERARIGVIGTGWWSTFAHLPSLASYPSAELIGVADLDRAKAEQAAARYAIPEAFDDHRALLALDPAGVIVATPHHTHYELVRDALLAGSDVMVEKPMVIDPAHGRELVEIARQQGRNLHVGYPYPYTRHSQLLRDLIQAGELGEILFTSSLFATSVHDFYQGNTSIFNELHEGGALWGPGTDTYSSPEKGGGQMLTQVTHSASHLFFLTGLRPSKVAAFTGTLDTQVDVWDAISFQTETSAAGTVASTGTVHRRSRGIEGHQIFGSKGHAIISISAGTLEITSYEGGSRQETPLIDDEQYPLYQTSRQLVDTILGQAPVVASGELGLLTVEFLAAALESAREERIVTLPSPSRSSSS
jgi:predicted dehydrogenase